MKKYWLHRCTCGDYAWPFTHELLKRHKFISIGWSDFSNTESQKELALDMSSFDRIFKEKGYGTPSNRYNLRRFIVDMKAGDTVVVPLPGGIFDIYRIADNEVYNNETFNHSLWVDWNNNIASLDKDGYPAYHSGQIDMGFYRKVEVIRENLSRNDYATQALYSRMKYRGTNTDISDLAEDVEKSIANMTPINLKGVFISEAAATLCKQMQNLMNPGKMESLVAWYMKSLGASVDIPSKNAADKGYGDADIVAMFEKLNDHTIMVQVKHHKKITGDWAVEQIKRYAEDHRKPYDHKNAQLWVVSSCDGFSDDAIRLSEEHDVYLVDGVRFAEMLINNGLYSLPV